MLWYSGGSLKWLQRLLYERFGCSFVVDVDLDGVLRLSLPGQDKYIATALEGHLFGSSNSDAPCAFWAARSELPFPCIFDSLPAPCVDRLPSPLIVNTAFGLHIQYDMFGMVYWVLNRIEEIAPVDLDVHGRFPSSSSHAVKNGYLARPLVDEWLFVFGIVLKTIWPRLKLKTHSGKVMLSHDVDRPSMYAFKPWRELGRMMLGDLVKRGTCRSLIVAPIVKHFGRGTFHRLDPYNTFDWIMSRSEELGLRSAFYFLCSKANEKFDADYELECSSIAELLVEINARGHEIGLHPSYDAVSSPQIILREFNALKCTVNKLNVEQGCWGGRMHYLRWSHPATLLALAEAGLNYDSTLGYPDIAGFRCGTCFEYPGFDPVTQADLPIRIRPLVAMDSALFGQNEGDRDLGLKYLSALRISCARVGGDFTLLWHNSSLYNANLRSMYLMAIQSLS